METSATVVATGHRRQSGVGRSVAQRVACGSFWMGTTEWGILLRSRAFPFMMIG